jgi:hypothetical protein
LKDLAASSIKKWKSLDYVAGWLLKAAAYSAKHPFRFSFVCTSSVSEGLQVSLIWPHVLGETRKIFFGHRPFKWSNLAKSNAGVSVVIVGVTVTADTAQPKIFEGETVRLVDRINPYLVPAATVYVETESKPLATLPRMVMGSMPRDGGHLILSQQDANLMAFSAPETISWIRRYLGTDELVKGLIRYCMWICDADAERAHEVPALSERFAAVAHMRETSPLASTNDFADRPHRFVYLAGESSIWTVAVGGVSSETREYLPVALLPRQAVVSNLAFAVYDGPLWSIALVASRIHLAWVAAVCGRLETRYRYSNTLGWNTFPVPALTDQNKADLTRSAENILLAREAHFPATIADLYDPDNMPADLRAAHDRNDETLERIYIGRRFKNDTERLEKLFELYTQMTEREATKPKPKPKGKTRNKKS